VNRAAFSGPNEEAEERSWFRRAELRELTGYDERFISEGRGLSSLALMIGLLGRVATLPNREEKADALGRLSIGECIQLMLAFRRATLGDRLSCELACPECGAGISMELSVDELTNRRRSIEPPSMVKIGDFALVLRPVTVHDVEVLSLGQDRRDQAERLVRSCVVSSEPPLPEKLTDELLTEIASYLETLDSAAETLLRMECPACGRSIEVSFSIEDFLLREIESRSHLEREVHLLALNYHWSEDAILSLPTSRRKQYVELVNGDFCEVGA
jgi:hypothetical protein